MNEQYGRTENVVRSVSMIIAVVLIARDVEVFNWLSPGAFILGFNLKWICQIIWQFAKKLWTKKTSETNS